MYEFKNYMIKIKEKTNFKKNKEKTRKIDNKKIQIQIIY